MTDKVMWIGGRRYYYFDTFKSWRGALSVAKKYKKIKGRSVKYYISVTEGGGFGSPRKYYRLYLTNVVSFI